MYYKESSYKYLVLMLHEERLLNLINIAIILIFCIPISYQMCFQSWDEYFPTLCQVDVDSHALSDLLPLVALISH